jgi:hypothetical protein
MNIVAIQRVPIVQSDREPEDRTEAALRLLQQIKAQRGKAKIILHVAGGLVKEIELSQFVR